MLYGAPASEEPIPIPEAYAPQKPNPKDKDIYELNRKVKRFAEDAKLDSKIKGFAEAIAQKLKALLEKIKALWEKIKPLTEKLRISAINTNPAASTNSFISSRRSPMISKCSIL